jgi:hypothetical protein
MIHDSTQVCTHGCELPLPILPLIVRKTIIPQLQPMPQFEHHGAVQVLYSPDPHANDGTAWMAAEERGGGAARKPHNFLGPKIHFFNPSVSTRHYSHFSMRTF